MKEEFYIGYGDKMPKQTAGFIKKVVISLLVTVVIIGVVLSSKQRGFLESTYEYYQDTEVTGYLIGQPVSALQVTWGYDQEKNPIHQIIPVVAFGKKGGKELVNEHLNTQVTAKGKLIYYDGKVLMEITEPNLIKPISTENLSKVSMPIIDYGGPKTLTGEIVDAKCFFGVMKPGHGKPHRACAIRCISGGIPAVFRSRTQDGTIDYYLIAGQLESTAYVGELVEITGTTSNFDDWKLLKIDGISPVGMRE